MPTANIKKVIPVLILSVLIIIVGCSSPQEKRAKSLSRIADLQAAGETVVALQLLEALSQTYPDDSEILQQIGLIQQELGNYTEAAFYLNAAYNLSPENAELLYQTYLASEDANQFESALELLEVFAETNSKAMTSALWFRLGELRAQANKTESALEAYLEGIKLKNEKPSSEIALTIGNLFKQLNNLPMAERWLAIAAKSDDPNALPALFGLLEIYLRTKNFEAAEQCIVLLDKKFPGAVDASDWAKTRIQLKKWRAAQVKMKEQLEKIARAEKEAEAERAAEAERKARAEKEAEAEKEAATEVAETSNSANTIQESEVETSGKAQVVADMENAEALASKPAIEAEAETAASKPTAESDESEIVFNPDILIQPAEPETDSDEETVDFQNQETTVYVDNSTNYQSSATSWETTSEPVTDYEPVAPAEPETTPEPITPDLDIAQLSLEELITRADAATLRRDYDEAIQLYWSALGQTNQRADIWNALSKVYLAAGQAKNAATTALEATRLNPQSIDYLLDYLRVAQRVKKSADFIKELEIAYERFPRSPEITLSLARGYHKIDGNDYAASILYRRFIQMAPNHPLRREAEAALERMR